MERTVTMICSPSISAWQTLTFENIPADVPMPLELFTTLLRAKHSIQCTVYGPVGRPVGQPKEGK